MIRTAEENVKDIHKKMNTRDSQIVETITKDIDSIVHSIMTFPDTEI